MTDLLLHACCGPCSTVAVPAWRPYRHVVADDAVLVRASDEPLMRALGLLRTERLDAATGIESRG